MSRKIRVLQSMDTIGIGGTEAFVMNLYHSIDRDIFDFDFVVYDDYKTEYQDEVIKSGGKVYIYSGEKSNKILTYTKQKSFVDKIIKEGQYDIVHCNGNSLLGILRAAIPAHKNGVHVITHSHNMGEENGNLFDKIGRTILKKRISEIAEYGYTCSDLAGKGKYTDSFIASHKYKIIENGIDIEKYSYNITMRKQIRASLNIDNETLLIGHVGRFEYPKNQSYLIDIFAEVLKLKSNVKLMLVGDGIQREEIENKIRIHGIEDSVIFLGLRTDVNEIYNAMDIFVLPSIHEGFPFVLVEAQTNGLKCVVTENMSKDVNISGGISFLSTNVDPSVWAGKIVNTNGRLTQEQIQKVTSRYDVKQIAINIERDYKSLIK